MEPAVLPKMTHWRGDLWRDGFRHFGPMVDENGGPPAPPCLYCRMQFRDKKTGAMGYELNSDPGEGQGTITIVDGTNYEFDLPEQALPLNVGTYQWDFETYTTADTSGLPITWFTGEIVVKQDITRD